MTCNTTWRRLIIVTACLLCTVVTSCSTDSPTSPLQSQRPQADVVVDTEGKSHTLLDGQIPSAHDKAEAWIDQYGGYLFLDGGKKNGRQTGHFLFVPPQAVRVRTLFRVELDGSGKMAVRLYAFVPDRLKPNQLVDVGAQGFRVPVILGLNYAWATNPSIDASRLFIMYDPENGKPWQKLATFVSGDDKYLVAALSHFSKYACAQ